VGPSKDMVLGVYYLTMAKSGNGKETPSRVFADIDEVAMAYELGLVRVHDPIRVRLTDYYASEPDVNGDRHPEVRIVETTVGRVIFNQVVPETLRFVNAVLDRGEVQKLVARCYQKLGPDATTDFVDAIKDIGFQYATRSGTTIAVSDLTIPEEKYEILDETSSRVAQVERQRGRCRVTRARPDRLYQCHGQFRSNQGWFCSGVTDGGNEGNGCGPVGSYYRPPYPSEFS
jgi:DNA-directed RNA polymerase subunit beta'